MKTSVDRYWEGKLKAVSQIFAGNEFKGGYGIQEAVGRLKCHAHESIENYR